MGTGKLHTLQNNFGGLQLSTEYVSPLAIRTSRRRVRKHSKSQLAKLQAAISRWGFNVPLLVDDQNELVSGFARLDVALALKLESVPVIALSHLTREQLELFRIFEDKIGEDTDWCEEALVEVFGELRLADGEIVLEDSGFSVAEIDTMQGRLRTEQLNDLDDASEPGPDHLSVSRLGDLWLCGRHRLMCADATLPQNITSLVGDGPVHQVITDPPYALRTKFFSSTGKHPDFLMGAGEMNASEFTAFLSQFLQALAPHLIDGALIYTFMDWRHNVEMVRAAQDAGFSYKNRLVWVKPVGGMGSLYRSAHEDIHVFKNGSAPARNNIELGKWGRNRTNVLHYPGVMTSGGRKKALARRSASRARRPSSGRRRSRQPREMPAPVRAILGRLREFNPPEVQASAIDRLLEEDAEILAQAFARGLLASGPSSDVSDGTGSEE